MEGRMKNENVITGSQSSQQSFPGLAFCAMVHVSRWLYLMQGLKLQFLKLYYLQQNYMKDNVIPAHWGKHMSLLTGRGKPAKGAEHPKGDKRSMSSSWGHPVGKVLQGISNPSLFVCSALGALSKAWALVLFLYSE